MYMKVESKCLHWCLGVLHNHVVKGNGISARRKVHMPSSCIKVTLVCHARRLAPHGQGWRPDVRVLVSPRAGVGLHTQSARPFLL